MPKLNFKSCLLLGAALTLAACGQTENTAEKVIETKTKIAAETAKTMKDKAHKMIEYTTAGQTDEDHLYLEEVLGDKALADVKGLSLIHI